MGNKLPEGWTQDRLGNICTIAYGKDFRKKNIANTGEHPVYGANGIIGYHDRYTHKDEILVIGCRGSVGNTRFSKCKSFITHNCLTIEPSNDIEKRFLRYAINASNLTNVITGTSQPQITITNIEKLDIPFPDMDQQKRIADKLDVLLAKVKDCQTRLGKIPLILKRFRQSILASAFSGELTKEWRKKNKVDNDWKEACLGEVLDDLKYGTAKKCVKEKKKYTVLRIPNVVQGYLDLNNLKYADLDKKEYTKLKLEVGDILLIRSNGSVSLVGRTALVDEKEQGMAYAGYLIRLRAKKDLVIPEFLQYQFESYAMRIQIELPARSTSGVNNINSHEVKNLKIALPSIQEQKEVIRRLNQLFAFLERNKKEYDKAESYADKLGQSILAKAFRGELVQQEKQYVRLVKN